MLMLSLSCAHSTFYPNAAVHGICWASSVTGSTPLVSPKCRICIWQSGSGATYAWPYTRDSTIVWSDVRPIHCVRVSTARLRVSLRRSLKANRPGFPSDYFVVACLMV